MIEERIKILQCLPMAPNTDYNIVKRARSVAAFELNIIMEFRRVRESCIGQWRRKRKPGSYGRNSMKKLYDLEKGPTHYMHRPTLLSSPDNSLQQDDDVHD